MRATTITTNRRAWAQSGVDFNGRCFIWRESGNLNKSYIVMHFTGSWGGDDVKWLMRPKKPDWIFVHELSGPQIVPWGQQKSPDSQQTPYGNEYKTEYTFGEGQQRKFPFEPWQQTPEAQRREHRSSQKIQFATRNRHRSLRIIIVNLRSQPRKQCYGKLTQITQAPIASVL